VEVVVIPEAWTFEITGGLVEVGGVVIIAGFDGWEMLPAAS
jgi:hypothetical protein